MAAKKEIQECLGENIKRLRVERGYTQLEFAAKTELSISFLQNIEAGKRWVGPETIRTLARHLKVSQSALFADCDMSPEPDPKAVLALLCRALGVSLLEEALEHAQVRRPFAHYAVLYEKMPEAIGERLRGLCEEPGWDWAVVERALAGKRR